MRFVSLPFTQCKAVQDCIHCSNEYRNKSRSFYLPGPLKIQLNANDFIHLTDINLSHETQSLTDFGFEWDMR